MEMKTVFELKTLAKERGLHRYSRLTRCELVQLLQRQEEPMDMHQPVSRGFAVFADAWLSGWLAKISADLRETVAN